MSGRTKGSGRVLRGALVNVLEDPQTCGEARTFSYHSRGALVVDRDGRIAWRGPASRLPRAHASLPCDDHGDALLLPGFIDTHTHFPQYRMLAAPGRDLLDWLERFTFVEERRYRSRAHAEAAAEQFLDRLLEHGTTTAVAYSSVHRSATDALFEAAHRRGMALLAGKTLMDRNAPQGILDTAEQGVRDSAALLECWHGRGRCRYVITVRFAITSTPEQMRLAQALHQEHPQCLLQTHLAESEGEIQFVKRLFPRSRDYTDVYDRFGLLGSNSLFAHGIHLSERECARLYESRSVVVHCPTSNNFLGSGLFDVGRLSDPRHPVRLGLATDVGGGTSYSMLQTMAEAYKVAKVQGQSLSVARAFYLSTLGNARAIGLEAEIGSLDAGKWADVVVLDPLATAVLRERHALSRSITDVLFSLMMLGDDRAVRATYVAGRRVSGTSRARPRAGSSRRTRLP